MAGTVRGAWTVPPARGVARRFIAVRPDLLTRRHVDRYKRTWSCPMITLWRVRGWPLGQDGRLLAGGH
jgi:hypothetical protein